MIRPPVGATDFSHLRSVQNISGSHTASYIVGTGVLEVKLSGSETDNLSSASGGVKNEWGYSSTPPIYLHSLHMDKFTLAIIRTSQFLIRDSSYDNLVCSWLQPRQNLKKPSWGVLCQNLATLHCHVLMLAAVGRPLVVLGFLCSKWYMQSPVIPPWVGCFWCG